jgi:hypothetical protein
LNTDGTGNSHLSITAMILPTNDGFVGIDSLELPQTAGTYVYTLFAYDAGTEANDERVVGAAGGAPGVAGIPAAPGGDNGQNGTGVTTTESNATVHIHLSPEKHLRIPTYWSPQQEAVSSSPA